MRKKTEPDIDLEPGSPKAIAKGCTCPPPDERLPRGLRPRDADCPLHGIRAVQHALLTAEPEYNALGEQLNLNSGEPWSLGGDQDIRYGLEHDHSIEEMADFLCRTPSEVRQRIQEIREADAIGDPLLLADHMTAEQRVAIENYRDARAAMALIHEAVADCAPPGSVPNMEYFAPEFTVEAELLVRAIYKIAQGTRGRKATRNDTARDRRRAHGGVDDRQAGDRGQCR